MLNMIDVHVLSCPGVRWPARLKAMTRAALFVCYYLLFLQTEASNQCGSPEAQLLERVRRGTPDTGDHFKALSEAFEEVYGRPRKPATLGTIDDLPSEILEGAEKYTPNIENPLLADAVLSMKKNRAMSRSDRNNYENKVKKSPRGLTYKDHKPRIGCGVPVCTIIDMKIKTFRSICDMAKYLDENGMHRRVFEVQKGSCENASMRQIFIKVK